MPHSQKTLVKTFIGSFIGLSEEKIIERLNGIDVVLDASGLSAQQCENEPHKALYVNSYLPSRLATLSKKAGVKHFIYLSSIHVYETVTKQLLPKVRLVYHHRFMPI